MAGSSNDHERAMAEMARNLACAFTNATSMNHIYVMNDDGTVTNFANMSAKKKEDKKQDEKKESEKKSKNQKRKERMAKKDATEEPRGRRTRTRVRRRRLRRTPIRTTSATWRRCC